MSRDLAGAGRAGGTGAGSAGGTGAGGAGGAGAGGAGGAGTGADSPGTEETGPEEISRSRLREIVDTAIRVEGRRARATVGKVRGRMWRPTPERVISHLEKDYVRSVSRLGGAVGATAALPVLGTAVAVGLTGAQVAAFVEASTRHVLAVAEVHGIEVEDVEKRRTLLLAALLGEEGSALISGRLGLGTLAWARTALSQMSAGSVRSINKALAKRLAREGAQRGVGAAVGRLAPFGIGMVIGYRGTRALGREVVEGARTAFGPPPAEFAD